MLLQAQHKISGQPKGAHEHQVNLTELNFERCNKVCQKVQITTSLHQQLPWFPEVSPLICALAIASKILLQGVF